jgi:hypothetical protein
MTYTCPTWKFGADIYLTTLRPLQDRVLRVTGDIDRLTTVRDLHVVWYVYDYITKLCSRPAELILYHQNPNECAIGKGEARHRKYKRLKLGGGQAYDRLSV